MPRISMVFLLLAGCASTDFHERRLATIREDAKVLVPVSFSRDGRSAAYVEQRPDGCRMVNGSHVGKPYGVLC